MRIH
ncbi:hypothetical protein CGLO_18352 [Colletotrichum gloeosporioides Cg-14]